MSPNTNESFADLPIDAIARYLEVLGWSEEDSPNKKVRLFGGFEDAEGEPLQLLLPASWEYSDSQRRVTEVLDSVSAITGKQTEEVVEEISSPMRDLLKLRLVPQRNNPNFISIQEAAVIADQVRDVLAYSAQAEKETDDKRLQYMPKINQTGRKFVQSCRFGHTFKGSFGITVESDLVVQRAPLPLKDFEDAVEAPFSRKVLQRFSRGLLVAQAATENSNAELLVSSYKHGLTGNMCNALFKLFEQTVLRQVECRFIWSPSWLPDEDYVTTTTLTRKSASFLKLAADKLRYDEDSSYATLIGDIVKLDQAPAEEQGVAISVKGLGYRMVLETRHNERLIRVHMWLNDDAHVLACDAYRDKRKISVSGTLEKQKRGWSLRIPHDFHIEET